MNTALIVMTILGCNDAGTDCHYIATAEQRWPTVALCDAVGEEHLPGYADQPYPLLIAVCQNPQDAGVEQAAVAPQTPAPSPPPAPTTEAAPAAPVTPEEAQTLAGHAIERVRTVLPTTEGVKTMMVKPVRLVEDGYSWVARRFQ